MDGIEYITGIKQLIFNNNLFSATTNVYKDGSTRWKCTTKYFLFIQNILIIRKHLSLNRNCNSSVRILESVLVKQLDKPHDHPPLANCEKDIYIEIKAFKDFQRFIVKPEKRIR
jgi:hypothetical protein